jgi:hypothetical protein
MTTESNRPTRAEDPIALALEVVVYAPIGAAAYLREVGPDFVRMIAARGRAEVDARQEQVAARVRHAKGAGEVAIAFGLPMVRRRVEKRLASLRPPTPAKPATPPARPRAAAPAPAAPTPIVPAAEPVTAATATNGHRAVDTVDTVDTEDERLAIPGYDALSASQVVERLAGLSGEELDAVRRYEAGHRRRRTILGKIEQLSI